MIAMQIFRRIFTPEPRVRCQLHDIRAILDIHWLLDLEAEEEIILGDLGADERMRSSDSFFDDDDQVAPALSPCFIQGQDELESMSPREDPTDEEVRFANLGSPQTDLSQRMMLLSMGLLKKAPMKIKEEWDSAQVSAEKGGSS
jgi:hypothetical protein